MKYIFFLSLLFPIFCQAQKFRVSIGSGYGSYTMADMKTHQLQMSQQFPIDLTINKTFPASWYHEVSGLVRLGSRIAGGLALSYASTKGTMDYSDDPEEITCDQNMSAVEISPRLLFRLNPDSERFLVDAGLKGGVVYSNYELEFKSFIANESQIERYEFKSRNFSLEPGMTLTRTLAGSLAVHLYGGYNINFFRGNVYFKEEEKAFLENNEGDKVYIDWSGFRIGAGITLLLGE